MTKHPTPLLYRFLTYSSIIALTVLLSLDGQRSTAQEQSPKARGLNPNKPITQYIIDSWLNEQGLQATGIDALLQTRDGYLWIGTREGLYRFDGARLTLFDRSSAGFKSNRITALAEDNQQTLWVGTDAGIYGLQNGIFRHYSTKEGLSSNLVTCLYASERSGIVWIGTDGGGLNRFSNGKFSAYTTKDGLTSDGVFSIVEDTKGGLWVGTEGGGLNYLSNARCTPYILDNENLDAYTVGDPLPGATIKTLCLAADGTLWAGTSEGLSNIQPNGGYVKEYTTASGLSNNDIRSVIQDRQGTLWVATGGGGIQRITTNKATSTLVFSTLRASNGIASDETIIIYEDKEGSIWVGSEGGGLNRIKDRRFITYTAKDGLVNNVVTCVVQDSTGAFWIGANGGLSKLSTTPNAANTWTTYTTANGLANNIISALLTAKNGTLWIGTRSGVQSFAGNKLTAFGEAQGFPSDMVTAFAEAPDGALWMGTNAGIVKYANGVCSTFTTKDGLANNSVRALLVDKNGALWAGTRGGGLSVLQAGATKFTTYSIRDGLSSNFVWSLFEDRSGTLWIATGGGINRLSNGKFQSCTRRNGLVDDAIFSLADDAAGWLWVGSNKGIFRVRKSELNAVMNGSQKEVHCLSYGMTDGLKSLEISSGSQPAVCTARDGALWFATTRGVSMVEPLTIPYNPLAPTVLIEEVFADGKRIAGAAALHKGVDEEGGLFTASAYTGSSQESLTLKPGLQKFEFHYTATSLLMPERVKFRFMLEGYDESWVEAGSRRVAYYTNLPRNKQYTFRVQACNNDGVWNNTGATISFFLKPRFYETWWFLALCVVGAISGVIGFYTIRVRAIQRRNAILKKMVDEQTAEIRRQKDILAEQAESIKKQNTELEQKNILITASNEQMAKLLENIESSIRYAKRIQDAMLPNHDRMSHALPEYFVLYKPRDIVSGDFYWFVEHNGKIALAAADCTGHGVPGAFMSMIGHALLTEIVVEKDIMEPDKILAHLNAGIRRALKQDNNESRDGMDIALCIIDKNTRVVEYAGAMNPLCVVRNGQLEEVKATRFPIGGVQRDDEERSYSKSVLEFDEQNPIMLYVYSDGYQDQFGGADGRKFMSKRFKQMLVDISEKSMAEQRRILDETIEEWKGTHKQIDDILVMGVRLR